MSAFFFSDRQRQKQSVELGDKFLTYGSTARGHLTIRTGKRHRVQESSRSQKSVLKLASKLQHFLNTGTASKRDLKSIDTQITQLTRHQGDRIMDLLDQLKDRIPKSKGRETVEQACATWAKWLSSLDSKQNMGYADLTLEQGSDNGRALVESTIDAETDVFRMLAAFNSSLLAYLRQASYKVPDSREISGCAGEIIEAYQSRQKLLAKLSAR